MLLVAGFIAAWLFTADLGLFKPRVERFVTEATGRTFTIDGEFDVLLGGQTVIVANDVRFANAEWADERQMLDIGRFELRLDLWSLLRGPLQIDLVSIANSRVHLQRSDSGERSWEFGRAQADETDSDEAGSGLLIEQLVVEDVHLVFSSPERSGPVDLHVQRLTQELDSDEFLRLDLGATLSGRDVSIDGRVGSWDALLAQTDIEFDMSANIDTLSLSARGQIDDLTSPRRPTMTFAASGPDLNDLARLLGIEESFIGDIDLSGSLAPASDGALLLEVEGNVGQMQAVAKGSFSDLQKLDQASLDLAVNGPDLNRLLRLAGLPPIPATPYSIDIDAERSGPEVVIRKGHLEIAEATLDLAGRLPDFPTFDGADVQMTLTGQKLERLRELVGIPGAATGPYSLTLEIREAEDGVEIAELAAQSSLVSATASGRLTDVPEYVGSSVDFELQTGSLAAIAEAYRITSLPERPLSVAGSVELTAEGLRSLSPVSFASDDVTAAVEGLVTMEPRLEGSNLTVQFSAADAALAAADLAGIDGVPVLAVSADGRVTVRDGGYQLRQFRANLGQSSIGVDGLIRPGDGGVEASLTVTSEGPALEELTSAIDGLTVAPGPFSLSTGIIVGADAIRLEGIDFSRQRGQITGTAALMLPVSERALTFDLRGEGDDLRSVTGTLFGFEPAAEAFDVKVRGNTLNRLLTLDELDFAFADASLRSSGQLDFEEVTAQTRFALGIRIPDLSILGTLNGRRFNQQPFSLNANVRSRSGALSVDDLVATVGESDIRGRASLKSGEIPNLSLSLKSRSVRIAPLLATSEEAYEPEPEFEDGRVIPDVPIPFEQLQGFNASIEVDIGDLERDALRVTDLRLVSTLADGTLVVEQFGFRGPEGWLQARGSLGSDDGTGKLNLELTAKELSVAIAGLNDDLSASADLDTRMTSAGNDLRTLVGNLNGVAFLRLNKLTVGENRFFRRLYGDLLNEIVSTINPFAKTSTKQQLDCVVVPLEVTDGMLQTRPSMLIITDRIRIASQASINLRNEKIDFQFNTTPRKGITISAGELFNPYVKVTGTLARPRLAVDQQGVLISGGTAVATGGLSILAKVAWERLLRDDDPCTTASDLGVQAIGDRFANLEPPGPG